MADTKVSALTELTAPDAADELPIVDKSDTSMAASGTDKRIKLQTLVPIIVRKTADETVNNSNVLQNDDHLVLPVLASSTYQFELQLLTNAADATADWQFGWTVPAGATMFWSPELTGTGAQRWSAVAAATSQAAMFTEGQVLISGSAAVTGGLYARGIIRVAGTAGNVQLQWAQNTATASNSKVLTDSVLIARKIA